MEQCAWQVHCEVNKYGYLERGIPPYIWIPAIIAAKDQECIVHYAHPLQFCREVEHQLIRHTHHCLQCKPLAAVLLCGVHIFEPLWGLVWFVDVVHRQIKEKWL